MTGPARVFTSEVEAITAVKGQSDRPVEPGDVLVLMARGPMGSGMEETYQITSALKHLACAACCLRMHIALRRNVRHLERQS